MPKLSRHCHTIANFNTFDRIDAHHRMRDIRIKPVKHRLTQSHRHARCQYGKFCATTCPLLTALGNQLLKLWQGIYIRTKKWVTVDKLPINRIFRYLFGNHITNLGDITADFYPQPLFQIFLGNRARCYSHCRFAR